MEKKCTKCHIPKELNTDNFDKHPMMADGFRNECKVCISKKDKERYEQKKKDKIFYQFA